MSLLQSYYKLPPTVRNLAICTYGGWQAYQRFSGTFSVWYEALLESQYRDQEEIRSSQLESVRDLLSHAYATVPYYAKMFSQCGVRPDDITSLEDLHRLPALTRADVMNNFDALQSSEAKGYHPILTTSSGTTGQKLRYMIPRELKWPFQAANQWRYYSWAGVKLGDRRATLGARIFATRPPYWAWNRWENQLLLSSHHLDNENLRLYAQLLDRFRIDFVQGHPSAIAVLAEYLLVEGRVLPMKGIFTTGETLYPDDREMIEKAFACRLFDSYGMGEWATAAQQCGETSGYHEISEACIIELDALGDGSCEVIGTSLLNYAMPFIRYRTGDIAMPAPNSECECGRNLPIKIAKVYGRLDDKIILPQRTVLPVTVRMHMKPLLLPGETYQVIQEDSSTIRVLLTGPVDSRRAQRIELEMMKFLTCNMTVTVEHTEEIRTQRNKIRNVISRIAEQ